MLNHRFWSVWRWLPWVLPVVFLGGKVLLGGGWEVLFLILYSPLIVGITGFLGWLPRSILKRRGHTTAPTMSIAFITVYWSSMVWWLLSLGVAGDTRVDPSLIRRFIPLISERQEDFFQGFALLVCALACLAGIIVGIVAKRPVISPQPTARRGAGWALLTTLIATPLIIWTASAVAESVALRGPADAGGHQQADVIGLSEEEVRVLQEQRWRTLQEQLIPVRESIAADGWDPTGTMVPDDYQFSPAPEKYQLVISWTVRVDSAQVSTHIMRLEEHLIDTGWSIDDEDPLDPGFRADSADGVHLLGRVSANPADPYELAITLEAHSPEYWTEGTRPSWSPIVAQEDSATTFRFDEWPPLIPAD